MPTFRLMVLTLSAMLFFTCKTEQDRMSPEVVKHVVETEPIGKDSIVKQDPIPPKWIEITEDQGFYLDLKYATPQNFTGQQIYDCGRCFLEEKTANALIAAQRFIKKEYNLRFVVYDCYRPLSAQQKLWDIKPDPAYVARPSDGSMHNRGMAIDISIVDSLNMDLKMGTSYDYFGREAHIDFTNLPTDVLENRQFLQTILGEYGFKGIRTEWWHFSHEGKMLEVENWTWNCNI